jgi:alanyl-tRNA synthetase
VLRRIIRRALRHGYKLGIQQPFFYKLVPVLVQEMGEAYPELSRGKAHAEKVLRQEEERFAETLANGMVLLEAAIRALRGAKVIDGDTAFKLYDTYGFPIDLTADIARERGLSVDLPRFEAAMQEQKTQSQQASKFGVEQRSAAPVDVQTLFQGYERTKSSGRVVALFKDGAPAETLKAGDSGEVLLERTPFYAEAGGQVGDAGELTAVGTRFLVRDTQKRGTAYTHIGTLEQGSVAIGEELEARVDAARRGATALNHSATHLLHAALRKVLGTHVQQKGSLVAPDRLRFDFAHFQPLTDEELREIERMVNAQIRANAPAETRVMEYDRAVAAGAIALFGEKYDKDVRVLRMGDFSMELCGGTHVQRMGDIGLFKIVTEYGTAAGVRRIEALTGAGALAYVEETDSLLKEVAALVRGSREDVRDKVREQLERGRSFEREARQLKDRLASGQGVDLAAGAVDVQGVKVVASKVDGADAGALRAAVDRLKDRLKSAVVVLASVEDGGKVVLVVGVTEDQTARIKAGELAGAVAAQVGGKGGGRPDFAQAGGSKPEALDAALGSVEDFVRTRLAA